MLSEDISNAHDRTLYFHDVLYFVDVFAIGITVPHILVSANKNPRNQLSSAETMATSLVNSCRFDQTEFRKPIHGYGVLGQGPSIDAHEMIVNEDQLQGRTTQLLIDVG